MLHCESRASGIPAKPADGGMAAEKPLVTDRWMPRRKNWLLGGIRDAARVRGRSGGLAPGAPGGRSVQGRAGLARQGRRAVEPARA